MTKLTYVYKAVASQLWTGKLMSCMPNIKPIEYKMMEFVKPTIGKILAFDTVEHAIKFWNIYQQDTIEIYEAAAIGAVIPEFHALCNDVTQYDRFWQDPMAYSLYKSLCIPMPEGTVLCDQLALLVIAYRGTHACAHHRGFL